ncbi:MAG TPA: hypothetical protein VE967_19570 [Gemmatimonadaceae bacterium]|nr:hypothetical protein [Gemmatimonadaceae bacterium]
MTSESRAWGVWGGVPGGWCHIGDPHDDDGYRGSRETALAFLERFRREYPELDARSPYEAMLFNPGKEPPFARRRLTPAMLECLKQIAARRRAACDQSPQSWGGFSRATYSALLLHGYVMNSASRRVGLRITRAGQAELDAALEKRP